jgi:hypothetical protein
MVRHGIQIQLRGLIDRAVEAHEHYYASEVFSGPSLYFHHRALDSAEAGDLHSFAEYAYAVLASWGMHRMGRGGAKMRAFEEFRGSLAGVWPLLRDLRAAAPVSMDAATWDGLERAFRSIRCMATGTSLVGNSKVLAHAIPNLVPPIDREYTLRYLRGGTHVANNIDSEWRLCRTILSEFFYPAVQDPQLSPRLQAWLTAEYPWNTSSLKIVDNLVIGIVRLGREPQAASV